LPDDRPQVLDPAVAYQMVSMMQGVVQRGTGSAVKAVGKPLAGKTGTTNDGRDVWFVGYSPDLVAGLYVGYDQPRTLGKRATGGTISAPIFRDFMIDALKDKPATPFRIPPGIRLVRVNYKTGQRPQPGDTGLVIWEAFRPGTEPNGQPMQVVEGKSDYGQDAGYGSVLPVDNGGQDQAATDSLPPPADYGSSILDMPSTPDTQQQMVSQQPSVPDGEGSNPADYHPSNAIGPNGPVQNSSPGQSTASPAAPSSDTDQQSAQPPAAAASNAAPLPATVDGLGNGNSNGNTNNDNTPSPSPSDNPPSVGGTLGAPPPSQTVTQQPAPAAPSDSSQGLY
jgi:penicillin-binding protein 1A